MQLPRGLVQEARSVPPTADAKSAADLMLRYGIGSLVVVDEGRRPVGVVTDRDLALSVIEAEADPAETPVSSCMSDEVVVLSEDGTPSTAASLLRRHGIRRLPVVDGGGRLIGIVTADDLLQHVAQELTELAAAIRRERAQEGIDVSAATAGSSVFGKE